MNGEGQMKNARYTDEFKAEAIKQITVRGYGIHSDHGSRFGSDDFVRWCKDNHLIPSVSRRSNCYDNAVAEFFFRNLKKERI